MKTLIKNGSLISMDLTKEPITKEDVVFEDDKIIFVGKTYEGKVDEIIDAKDKIVMPGLINCHTHLAMSIFRATNDNYTLDKWLHEFIWPIEDKFTDDFVRETVSLSLIEMIKTGTTCFNDMYSNQDGYLEAFDLIPIRGVYGKCLLELNKEDGIQRFKDLDRLVKTNKNDLIKLSIAPHALYTTNQEYLKKCEEAATKYGLPIHIHLNENRNEVNGTKESYKDLPVNVLDRCGFFNHKVILAHGTFFTQKEIDKLKGKDVSICTNPISNLNLGCGIADIKKYLDNGINVCLGTDGQGSGNNLNLFYHMSMLDNLQKAKYEDPTVMSSYDVLKIATINGAKALGMESEIGSIEVGKKADIIILDLNEIEMYPVVNPIIHIVHNAWNRNVDTTIINGKILMKNKELTLDIDINNLKNKINECMKNMF